MFDDRSAGFGSIFRDHTNNVVIAALGWVPSMSSTLKGEAQALIWALQLTDQVGFQLLEVEIGNLQVSNGINKASPSLASQASFFFFFMI